MAARSRAISARSSPTAPYNCQAIAASDSASPCAWASVNSAARVSIASCVSIAPSFNCQDLAVRARDREVLAGRPGWEVLPGQVAAAGSGATRAGRRTRRCPPPCLARSLACPLHVQAAGEPWPSAGCVEDRVVSWGPDLLAPPAGPAVEAGGRLRPAPA